MSWLFNHWEFEIDQGGPINVTDISKCSIPGALNHLLVCHWAEGRPWRSGIQPRKGESRAGLHPLRLDLLLGNYTLVGEVLGKTERQWRTEKFLGKEEIPARF